MHIIILSKGIQSAHSLNVKHLPPKLVYFALNDCVYSNQKKHNLTHRAVHHDDIVLICSEPGIHCTTNINKLLQVRHTAVRPREIINLLEEGEREREREREGKQRGASWVRVVIHHTLCR